MSDTEKAVREIRINPIVPTESVLVATARGMRARRQKRRWNGTPAPWSTTCPFCRGNEEKTPPAIGVWPNSTLSHYVLRARSYVVIINTLFYKGILR